MTNLPQDERSEFYLNMKKVTSSMVRTSGPYNKNRNLMVELLADYDFDSTLEIGCNIGTAIYRIYKAYGGRCVGFDFNASYVQYAQNTLPQIVFRCHDAEHMLDHYQAGNYDLIVSVAVLMHCGHDLTRKVCENIMALKPKLIMHQEVITGRERVIKKINRVSGLNHFHVGHDIIGNYKRLGVKDEQIKVWQPSTRANLTTIIIKLDNDNKNSANDGAGIPTA